LVVGHGVGLGSNVLRKLTSGEWRMANLSEVFRRH
jgi:hypothetical protein